MESVRLISSGTSASVTAASTYRSGGLVVFNITAGIAFLADAAAVQSFDVGAGDPLAAHITATRLVEIRSAASRADMQFLIGRRIQTMALIDLSGLFKERTAFDADQHEASSSTIEMY